MTSEEKKQQKMMQKIVGGCVTGVILLAIIIFICLITCKIEPGYVGVVYSVNGGITGETFDQGWHFKSVTEKVTDYSIGIEQSYLTATNDGDSPNDDSFSAPSKDGKGLQMELTFTYRYDENRVTDTFTRFKGRSGKDLLTTFIKPNVISWTKEITATYPVAEILGDKRSEINIVLSDYLAKRFDEYGIIIENASLINITTDQSTTDAIQEKIKAQQQLEVAQVNAKTAEINAEKEKKIALIQAEQEKEAALIDAERNKEVAEINAEKEKIEAEGKAAAVKIQAEAEAEANKEIAASLTPELIEKFKYEAWDGKLPQIQTGTNSSQIIDMRENNN